MNITKEYLTEKIKEFENSVRSEQLPQWEDLPEFDLYMDQVIILLNQYLGKDITSPITQSMINNYVKLKAIPAPVKKRYSKIHLAYLIIFCTLKQTLNIATIQKIMPVELNDGEVSAIYKSFLVNRQKSIEYAVRQTNDISKDVFSSACCEEQQISDIIMQVSNTANVFKSLTEKILIEKKEENN